MTYPAQPHHLGLDRLALATLLEQKTALEIVGLGETPTTAYRGDRGKTAYDHSQTLGNPHGLAWSDISGSVLAAVWLQITIASGGPPVLGATMQDNGGQSFVWSAFTFYVDTEEGFLTLTEDNQLEIVE